MSIKNGLKEIVKSLSIKLMDKDFEVIKIEDYTTTVRIDGVYDIEIWMASGPDHCTYYDRSTRGVLVSVEKILTLKYRKELYCHLESARKKSITRDLGDLIEEKRRELVNLERDLKESEQCI